MLVIQSRLTLCNPKDCGLPAFSVCGILQARILEWVAMPSSRGPSQPRIEPRSATLQADSLPSEPSGKPWCIYYATHQDEQLIDEARDFYENGER